MKKLLTLVLISSLLFACGKTTTSQVTPTPKPSIRPKLTKIELSRMPAVSLVPRNDGHEIKLLIKNIPSNIAKIEYELLYSATDGGLSVEKGLGDTIQQVQASIERDLLLGTSSCTSGCKYKYDSGVTGGKITLNFITNTNEVATFESDFSLQTGADIKRKGILLVDFPKDKTDTYKAGQFVIALKNSSGEFVTFASQ